MDPTLLILIAVFALLMWWMSRNAKKQRQAQEEARDSAIQVGATVRTIGGFYGTVVDIDGDAVTLESPSGIETVWFRNAIQGVATLPLGIVSEDDAFDEVTGGEPIGPALIDDETIDSTLDNPIEKRDNE
ncbi:MAG TPA: preprotein translocase subunit YajC [Actinomycetaceae bacterium]|nr:preprotein translocase subunit YajC [Actinomycetaceae bacterium]